MAPVAQTQITRERRHKPRPAHAFARPHEPPTAHDLALDLSTGAEPPGPRTDPQVRRLKVLVVCYEYPPVGGGGAPACQGICESMVRQGHHVDVVTSAMSDLPRLEERRGVVIHRTSGWRRHRHYSNTAELLSGLVPAYRRALKLTRQSDYDLIHCHFAVPSGLVARALSRKTGIPYVITAHGSDIPGYNPDRFNLVHKLIGPTWRSIMSEAQLVNTPSQYLRDLLLKQVNVPTQVIPYGFTAPPGPRTDRRDRVLVVSRMFERKGVQHVIQAMAGIDTHWKLCIVGDGPYLPTLKAQAAAAGLDADFRGYVQGPELLRLYHSARVFALPSSSDNFPVVLLEAMAAGLAVITSRGNGCAEVVGEAGLTTASGNVPQLRAALQGLIDNPAEVRRRSELALQRVQRFHWDRVGSEYRGLYDNALAMADPDAGTPRPTPLAPLPDRPRVTVMMANHNHGQFVGDAIRSVLDQTYDRWELLICDDGSTDDSLDAIREAAGSDPRVRVFQTDRGGQAAAWNTLWPHARGELLCLLDSDSLYEPHKLQSVVDAFARQPEVGLIVHRLQVISGSGKPVQLIPYMTRMEHGFIADRLIRRGGRWRFLPTTGLCVRREIAEPLFPMDVSWFGPWADSLLFYAGPMMTPVSSLAQPLARYRVRRQGDPGFTRLTASWVWHDLHSVRKAIKGTNQRLDAQGMGRPLDSRRHLQLRAQAFVLARLWGRRGGIRGYAGLMRSILADDLYSWPQKGLAGVAYGMLLVLPRRAHGPWLGETIGISRFKSQLSRLTGRLPRRAARLPRSQPRVALGGT